MGQTIGVLALQGAFARHVEAFVELGFDAIEVRTAEQLSQIDRLTIPGGESTTMSMMLDRNELREPIAARIADGMPVFGTCAGMILLAADVSDGRPDQKSFGALDISVRRNGYGRQNQSFSTDLDITGLDEPMHATFIRAPVVERLGDTVEALAYADDKPVVCRSGSVLVTAFHPELSMDRRLHRYFCELS